MRTQNCSRREPKRGRLRRFACGTSRPSTISRLISQVWKVAKRPVLHHTMVVAAVLGASALALDAWVLSGLPVPRVSPRVQWAVAPTWIIVSFCCLAVGTVPLVAALEGWLGPLRSTPRGQVPQYEQAALMVFAALAAAHISGLFFAPTAQRRHLCFLGVAITGWYATPASNPRPTRRQGPRQGLFCYSRACASPWTAPSSRTHPSCSPPPSSRARMAAAPSSRCATCCGRTRC